MEEKLYNKILRNSLNLLGKNIPQFEAKTSAGFTVPPKLPLLDEGNLRLKSVKATVQLSFRDYQDIKFFSLAMLKKDNEFILVDLFYYKESGNILASYTIDHGDGEKVISYEVSKNSELECLVLFTILINFLHYIYNSKSDNFSIIKKALKSLDGKNFFRAFGKFILSCKIL